MISSQFTEKLVVTRAMAGAYANGVFVPGATRTLRITGSVQALKGLELLNFPEAQRTREIVRIYSDKPLVVADVPNAVPADIVQRSNGVRYEVHEAAPWQQLGLKHFKAIAVRLDPPPH